MTIRRDLDLLERGGIVKRLHGGAIATRRSTIETPYEKRSLKNQDEKRRIAKLVVSELRDGQSIAIGAGSTPHEIAALLFSFKRLNVLTPSLRSALMLAQFPSISTIVPGVTMKCIEATMVGAEVVRDINSFYFDIAILGAAGVDIAIGITEYNADEVAVTRAMIQRAARSVVVADSTKLGRVAAVVVAELGEIDTIVTGREANGDVVRKIREAGTEVKFA